jgi:hypothetical protein
MAKDEQEKNPSPKRRGRPLKKPCQIEPRECRPLACSVQETMGLLGGICKPTLYTLLHQGLIKSFFIGKRRMISYDSLVQFCKERAS